MSYYVITITGENTQESFVRQVSGDAGAVFLHDKCERMIANAPSDDYDVFIIKVPHSYESFKNIGTIDNFSLFKHSNGSITKSEY